MGRATELNPVSFPVSKRILKGSLLNARYLMRFNDLCPTMDWSVWNEIEPILIEVGVNPILSVIPDNRDPKLMIDPPVPDFWDRVRNCQVRGWTIGLQGYQHLYVNGKSGILCLNLRSEFAGLKYAEQYEKLSRGLEIFAREGVRADTWVAPVHSFDWVTLSALNALGIRIISDGLSAAPYRDFLGNVWVPQQFASTRRMPLGVWTYCYHSNDLSCSELQRFKNTEQSPLVLASGSRFAFTCGG